MNRFGFFLIILSVFILVGAVTYITQPLEPLITRLDKQRIQDLTDVSRALYHYYQNYGRYPSSSDSYMIITNEDIHVWGNPWLPYMTMLPKDPSPFKRYVYWADKNNNYQTYRLYASLTQPDLYSESCKNGKECGGVPAPDLCGTGSIEGFFSVPTPCNFGITSNNISP